MNMKKYHQMGVLGGGGAGRGGCGGSAATVERGRVRWVVGGGGASGGGCGWDRDRDGGGSRSSVLMNIQYFFILNMKKYHQI